jgi:HSP20 family molecular chaperone IbpA
MPEKSAAAAQTAPSKPLVTTAKPESLSQRIEDLYDRIAKRAYALFESHGGEHGHDVEHWVEAEKSILNPMNVQLEDGEAEIIVRADVPGFNSDDLEIQVEPERLTIAGSHQSKSESKKDETVSTEESLEEIFQTIPLPAEVETAKVNATLKNGVLTVTLPKIAASKSTQAAKAS